MLEKIIVCEQQVITHDITTIKEFEKLLKEKQIVFRPDEMEFKLGRKTIEDYFMVFFCFPTVSARTMFVGNPASQLGKEGILITFLNKLAICWHLVGDCGDLFEHL